MDDDMMKLRQDHPGWRRGADPFETERQAAAAVRHITTSPPAAWEPGLHQLLESACQGTGVTLGAYDHRILLWLAGWEPSTVSVIAGLITRAHEAGLAKVTA